jgi:uncharacterized protein with FMN-binding domain
LLRAVLALGGTAAGIAALIAVKFHPAASSTLAGSQSLASPSATAPAATAPPATAHPAVTSSAAKPSAKASSSSSSGGNAQSTTARTFTGAVDNTQYGPMQVAITVSGKTITKITVLQQTDNGSESQSIDSMALPKLTSEALAAQNANIDAVSGASYTSAGYKQSLQSAIDMAGL